jgi:hypothetical protein
MASGSSLANSPSGVRRTLPTLATPKKQWTQCANDLSIPFVTFHRNDAPAEVLETAQGKFPVVLARTSSSLEIVIAREELDALEGSPERLAQLLQQIITS